MVDDGCGADEKVQDKDPLVMVRIPAREAIVLSRWMVGHDEPGSEQSRLDEIELKSAGGFHSRPSREDRRRIEEGAP
jgi:hypothetical protein